MEPIHPSSPPTRRWRLTIPISLGVLVLSASLFVAALSLRSHAGYPPAPTTSAAKPADDARWCSLGYVDIEGGISRLYPLQLGRVKRIEARENKPIKAGEPLFHLDDTVPLLKRHEAERDLQAAQDKLVIAQSQVKKADEEIAAQKIAIANARKNVEKARIVHDQQKQFLEDKTSGDKASVDVAKITVEQAEQGVKGEEAKLTVMEAAKRVAEGYVTVAKTNIEAKKIQFKEAQHAVNECVVRAAVDGTPLRILVNEGEVLGSNPHQPAVWFAANRPLLVRAEVEQEFVGKVRLDQNVVIEDNVTGQECARGKVVSIAHWYAPRRNFNPEMAPMSGDNRTLECIINLDPESFSKQLRIDQRVRVQFAD